LLLGSNHNPEGPMLDVDWKIDEFASLYMCSEYCPCPEDFVPYGPPNSAVRRR